MTAHDGILNGASEPPAPAPRSFLGRMFGLFRLDMPGGGKLRPTAYLDGLRGFMALLVYIHHNNLWAHTATTELNNEAFEGGWGFRGHRIFAALPFVRNFFTGGHQAVAVFFVISGYVLSTKALQLIIDGQHAKLTESLASSLYRRWFRLYIPIALTTFVYVTSWHVPGYWVSNATRQGSLVDEWWNWYAELKNMSFVFKEGPVWVSYNTHLWSIPLEMRGSIVTFTALLAVYRFRTSMRLLTFCGLTYYFLYIADAYYCALFTAGTILCDLDLLRARNHPDYPAFLLRLGKHATPLSIVGFVVGMFLAGVPSYDNNVENLRQNPMWYYLSYLKAQAVFDYKWFFLFFGSVLMVATIPNLPPLKRFFESRFCQYLGRISYALYLVHGPVLSSIGDRVYFACGWVRTLNGDDQLIWWANKFPVPRIGPAGLELSLLVPQLVLVPLTFGIANFVTTHVDDAAVRWPATWYKFCLASDAAPVPPRASPESRLA